MEQSDMGSPVKMLHLLSGEALQWGEDEMDGEYICLGSFRVPLISMRRWRVSLLTNRWWQGHPGLEFMHKFPKSVILFIFPEQMLTEKKQMSL